MKISGQRRKAISPIVATVLIIAATLIAFAAVLGYIFGIFGSSTNSANVTVSSASCVHGSTATTAPTCTIYVTNSGSGSTSASGGSITYGGTSYTLTFASVSIPGGTTTPLTVGTITVSGTVSGSAGETFNGYISLANGAEASFTGTMS
ncbi:MAG: type IV pilin [Nitrososphaerota archaeon]|nr:type IV pilin [Nitrososphaerota archaeon]